MEVKGYWTGYMYKGYVGKGVVGADKDGYKIYESDSEYIAEVRENAKENANERI